MNNVGNFSRSLLNYTDAEHFIQQLIQQSQKNKNYLQDPIIQELTKNESSIPKTNPFSTETFEGDAGKFAVPAAKESIDQLPGKMPLQSLGMPGPIAALSSAQNLTAAVPSALGDIYKTMEQAVTQGPYSSPTGEFDPKIATLPWQVMAPGFARASGLAAFGGRSGPKLGPQVWTKEKVDYLKKIDSELRGTKGSVKATNKRFRERFPDYGGSDGTIQRQASKIRNWGGANTETGANVVPNPAPLKGSSDFELGAFGGKGRLNTESPGEAMGYLQANQPVTAQWVKEWAQDAGVPVKVVKETKAKGKPHKQTSYVKMEDDQGKLVTVRVPAKEDNLRHIGYPQKGKEGSFFDTGTGVSRDYTMEPLENFSKAKQFFSGEGAQGGTLVPRYTPHEPNLINQAGMSYANPEALDAALKWRLHKAPFGRSWLIPEDMAPRLTPKATPKPMDNYNPYQDPNQLILDILGK